jgi:transposase
VNHDLPDEQKRCPHDGTPLEVIGAERSEQLDIVPAKVQVLAHIRRKYACPCCREHVVTAPLPAQPIPKSQASPGLLAHVAVSKYMDALPLHRQERIFQRMGIDMPRATLSQWMIRAGALVQPVINLLRDRLLEGEAIHCDETTLQVLKEPDKAASAISYMWVQVSGRYEPPVVLFDYDASRSGAIPKRLLGDFNGFLHTDGFEGYGAVCRNNGITQIGCWAHVRRKYDEALKAAGINPRKPPAGAPPPKARRPLQALRFMQRLFAIEHRIREAEPEERWRVRQSKSAPVVEAFRAWLDETLPKVVPGSAIGKALSYTISQWPKLIRFLDDGRAELHNNRAENAIRPFVIGRNNWKFSDTVAGAKASANLYSLIETAKANGLEPYGYLRRLFQELPKAESLEAIEVLLPWHFQSVTDAFPESKSAVA